MHAARRPDADERVRAHLDQLLHRDRRGRAADAGGGHRNRFAQQAEKSGDTLLSEMDVVMEMLDLAVGSIQDDAIPIARDPQQIAPFL